MEELFSPSPNEIDNVGSGFFQDNPDLSIQDEISNETNLIPEDVNLDDQCGAPRCVLISVFSMKTCNSHLVHILNNKFELMK